MTRWTPEAKSKLGLETFEKHAEAVRLAPERFHRLRVARTEAGLTRSELALLAHLSPSGVSRIERGQRQGLPSTQKALAAALGKTREEIFPNA